MSVQDPFDINQLAQEIDARLRAIPHLDTSAMRAVRREYTRQIADIPPDVVFALALDLTYRYGWRVFAGELLHYHKAALQSLGADELEQIGQGIDSWWAVDTFASYLSGPAWWEGQVGDELIHAWAFSEDRWWRRAALVSTVPLNVKARGGSGDVPRTLAVCRILVADHDDMVVKALSWALRCLVRHDPDAVRAFLAEFEGVLAARVKREVRNKLETGLKNPRKEI